MGYYTSISLKDISRIYFILNIIKAGVISIGNDGSALLLEFIQIIDNPATKECGSILKCGLVNNNCSALGFNTLHYTLNTALTEVVGITLHSKSVNTNYNLVLEGFVIACAVTVSTCDIQNSVSNEVLSCSVGLNDCLDEVLRNIFIVSTELFGILRQALSAITKGRIVVEITNSGIKTYTLDDTVSVKVLHLSIGIKLVEI